MASSGTWLFNPTLAEIVDEAFERCGINAEALTYRHLLSCRRSMNLMLADWQNLGFRQWLLQPQTLNVTPGNQSYAPAANTVDIFDMILRRQGVDTQMYPISRSDYFLLHNKTQPGRTDRFFFDKQRDAGVLYVWPVGDIAGDQILYHAFMQFQDVGSASNTPDIPVKWHDAFASDLSWRLALKYAPDRMEALKAQVWAGDTPAGALSRAITNDTERAPLKISVAYRRRRV